MPAVNLQEVEQDQKGLLKPDIETLEPLAAHLTGWLISSPNFPFPQGV